MRSSRNLLMIPDEMGVLEPDEVFVQCSKLDETDTWPAEPKRVVTGKVTINRKSVVCVS